MRRPQGFTLLEVLIAFAIAAMALAALTQAAAGGLRSSRVAAHTEQALSRAKSRLTTVARSPQTGEQRGDDGGGFLWRTLIRPAQVGESASPGTGRPILYDIRVEVSWTMDGGNRRVALETFRLGTVGNAP